MKNYREVAETVLKRRDAFQKAKKRKRDIAMRTTAGAGVLCLTALLGLGIYQNSALYSNRPDPAPGDPDVYYIASESDTLNAEASGALSDTDTPPLSTDRESASGEGSLLPVSYSSLSLPQGQVMPDIISAYAASSQSASDILPFSEELLSESSAVLEGRITDMYLKRYSYDTYNDKFGPKEVFHNQSSSVVYELAVDKVWLGDESLAGTSVLIEDDIYLVDSYFSLKVGCSYVIPVSDLEQEKQIWEEYAGGDLTRDGRYTSLYPYHPQIQVTSDGNYVVTSDWTTLCSGDAPNVLILPADEDSIRDTFVEYHPENPSTGQGLITTEWRTLLVSAYDAVFYYDKLKLVSSDEFFIRLNRLIDQLP